MFKKDSIFWLATCIFVSGVTIFAFTQNQLWLFLLAGSYLLRPTLASLNIAKSLVDERQMSIQFRSGNIAFAVMIIACIIMAVGLMFVLFASLENGFSIGALMESVPGLAIVGIGWLSKKFPRIIGVIVLVITAALLFIILQKGFVIGQIITAVVVSVPLTIAGISLMVGDRIETNSDNDVPV